MSRDEFLNELRIALQGNISQGQVNEHLRYYENYIIEESRKGRSEAEVINALGNPRLIAKTIIETEGKQGTQKIVTENEKKNNHKFGKIKFQSWYGIVAVIMILLLLIGIVTRVAIALLPIILPVTMIIVIFHLLFSGK